MAYELSHIIKRDQYIPTLIAQKDKAGVNYYSKWEPLSSDYQNRLQFNLLHTTYQCDKK